MAVCAHSNHQPYHDMTLLSVAAISLYPFMAFLTQAEMYLLPGVLVIGVLVIAFTFFSLTMLGYCNYTNHIPPPPTTIMSDKLSACMSLESRSITFIYKEVEEVAGGTNQNECVICLTAFQEEESVRKLHTCKHIFHTSCIDKWLGSHSGCPLCRTQIDKEDSPNGTVANDHMIMVIV